MTSEQVLHRGGVERQGEREHHIRSGLPEEQEVRREVEGLREDERSGSVHARLHFVDKEQVTPAFSARVKVAYHVFRYATHATDGLNQFHLHDGDPMRFQERINLSPGIRGEGIDVVNIGIERIDALLVGRIGGTRQREQGLASEARLEGEDVAFGKLGDESDLEGVLDGGRAADSG